MIWIQKTTEKKCLATYFLKIGWKRQSRLLRTASFSRKVPVICWMVTSHRAQQTGEMGI